MVLYISECVTVRCIIPFLKSDLDVSYLPPPSYYLLGKGFGVKNCVSSCKRWNLRMWIPSLHLYLWFSNFLSSKFTITLLFCVDIYFDDQNSRTIYIFRLLATNFNLCMLYLYRFDLELVEKKKIILLEWVAPCPKLDLSFFFLFFDFFFLKILDLSSLRSQF